MGKVCRIAMGPEGLMPAKVIPNRIDVMHYDQDGNEDKSQRQHIPSSFWSWFKPSGGGAEKPVAVVACGMTSVILRESFSPSIIYNNCEVIWI